MTTITTDAERDARRVADRERAEIAARALLTSEGWARWVRIRSQNGLVRYSVRNQCLLAMQCEDATYVAGFKAWLKLNRCVTKGSKAIRIMAPIPPRKNTDEDEDSRRVLYRVTCVFDVSQTQPLPDRDPVPLTAPAQPIIGDSHAHLIPRLHAYAATIGFTCTETEDLPVAVHGTCNHADNVIQTRAGLSPNATVRVLLHELAHAHGVKARTHGREIAEVIVDTAALISASTCGLDVSGESIPYIAGWGEDGALDAVREYASTIDAIARELEDAMAGSGEATE